MNNKKETHMNTDQDKIQKLIWALKGAMEMLEEVRKTAAVGDQAEAIDEVLNQAHAAVMDGEN